MKFLVLSAVFLSFQAFADPYAQRTVHCLSYDPDYIQLSVRFTRFEAVLFGTYEIHSTRTPALNQNGHADGSTNGPDFTFTLVPEGLEALSADNTFSIAAPQGVLGNVGSLRLVSEGQDIELNCFSSK
jgi:hypothetical protein